MSRSIKLDLVSAFAAAGAKGLAYAVVFSMLLAGGTRAADGAMFSVIRLTLGLLNYATLGIAPAFIRQFASAPNGSQGQTQSDRDRLYASAQYPSFGIGLLTLVAICFYALFFRNLHNVPEEVWTRAPWAALMVGLAMLVRLMSDVPGGYLQATGRITLDNLLLMGGDILWVIIAWILIRTGSTPLIGASVAFCLAYTVLSISRFTTAAMAGAPIFAPLSQVNRPSARQMLAFGAILTISQLSDFLYAPTDSILINWYLTPKHTNDYTIAIQLDGGMLLITAAIFNVLYPRAAHAVALRDAHLLRRYYIRGTILTTAMLIVASAALIWVAPYLLPLWLGTDAPGARDILPLVLLSTIIGGSSAPCRAILLAAGKASMFAWSAVAVAVLNVIISYILVRYTRLELVGVVIGTLVAITLRCVFFLPWYTMQTLREIAQQKGE